MPSYYRCPNDDCIGVRNKVRTASHPNGEVIYSLLDFDADQTAQMVKDGFWSCPACRLGGLTMELEELEQEKAPQTVEKTQRRPSAQRRRAPAQRRRTPDSAALLCKQELRCSESIIPGDGGDGGKRGDTRGAPSTVDRDGGGHDDVSCAAKCRCSNWIWSSSTATAAHAGSAAASPRVRE